MNDTQKIDLSNINLDLIKLEEVTKENLNVVMNLKVSELQKDFVAPNSVSIAQGCYNDKSWYRSISYDKTPIGFVMLHINEEKAEYYLWRYMIADTYQGLGFGKKAMNLIVSYVKSFENAKSLLVSAVPAELGPKKFYIKQGFIPTGEQSHGEDHLRLTF